MKMQNSFDRICSRFLVTIGLTLMAVITVRADYHSTVLADHPLAFYPINSTVDPTGTTATDLSGNGNNGTYNGTDPEFNTVPGPSPYIPDALMFDGFTSFVDLSTGSNPSLLNFSGPITMEAWVQPASPTVGSGPPADILAKGYDGTNEMTLRADGGYYYGGTYNNNTGGGNANGGQETTNWTYLVSTYDGTNWNLYENTKLVGQGSDAVGAINFTAPWAIGDGTTSTADGNSGDMRYFTGNLTEVALYTNALTPAQVLNHFCVGELGTTSTASIPIILTQPQPQTTTFGGTATFSVGVASALPTTNQWFKNNVAMVGGTNATLTITNAGGGDIASYRVVVGNSNGTTNSISASLTVLAANFLKWNSANTSGVWDTANSANWLNLSNSTQTVFSNFDQVLFDDTVGVSNTVTINGTVSPSLITVNSSTNNFTFAQGTSPLISGTGGLIKQGSSTLTILAPANFTGPVSIRGGTIYAGDNSFASVSSITVTNNSTLDIGGGALTGNKPVIVSGTGVNGEGAIFDSYQYSLPVNQLNITLAGDTVFGGSARWDLAAGSQISGPHNLIYDWSADTNNPYGEWTSVTIGADVAGITLTNGSKLGTHYMDSGFQNPATVITVQTNCQLVFWNGGWNGTIHLLDGGQAIHFEAPDTFNCNKVIMENGAVWDTYGGSGDQSINVPITLNGVARFVIGDNNRIYTNIISGAGGFVEDVYNHAMILSAANTYTGSTIIGSDGNTPEVTLTNNGSISHSSLIFFGGSSPTVAHMDVTGRPDQTLTLASGQTLAGVGGVNGSIAVSAGATLSPSGSTTALGVTWGGTNAVGAIAASANITLNGTTVIKLDGSGTNDVVQAAAHLTYGGTLNLQNINGSPLAAGNSFQVFSAASYSGSFASITPTTPGSGLAWDTNQLGSGILSVVTAPAQPVIGSTKVSGGNLIFSGSGGTANGTYYVLTSTNVATPLANWTPLATNAFDGSGNFNVTNAINPGVPHEFYLLKTP